MQIQIKSIVVKTLLILLATSFVLFGIVNFFNGVGNTNILKINNEVVINAILFILSSFNIF